MGAVLLNRSSWGGGATGNAELSIPPHPFCSRQLVSSGKLLGFKRHQIEETVAVIFIVVGPFFCSCKINFPSL